MHKFASPRAILAFTVIFGIGSAVGQEPTQSSTTTSQSSSQSSQTTTNPSDQSTRTESTAVETRTKKTDQQSTSTDAMGNRTTTTTTGQTTTSSRNRVVETEKPLIGEKDHRFLTKAAEGGLMEVHLAQLAQRQAASQSVKDYARQLEQDHTAANSQLTSIAGMRSVALPTTEMSPDHQAAMDRLAKLSGAEFDKQYIRMMLRDHRKDIKEFENEASNGMDTDLKNFASSALPTLRNHLQMAEQIDKGGTPTISSTPTTSTTTTTVTESTRSRGKGATVVQEDHSTINKVTPAPARVTTTQVDQTTRSSDGKVSESSTTVNKVTTKP